MKEENEEEEDDEDLDIDGLRKGTKSEFTKFVQKYLQDDGIFVMRLCGANTNAITVTEFICALWDYNIHDVLPETPDELKSKLKKILDTDHEKKREEDTQNILDTLQRHERDINSLSTK